MGIIFLKFKTKQNSAHRSIEEKKDKATTSDYPMVVRQTGGLCVYLMFFKTVFVLHKIYNN